MAFFPARKPVVNTIPEKPLISGNLEKSGIQVVDENFNAQVKFSGQNLITTSQNQDVTIQIPGSQNQLLAWSKGSIVNAITWFGLFWIRMIKKAAYFGWRIIFKNAG